MNELFKFFFEAALLSFPRCMLIPESMDFCAEFKVLVVLRNFRRGTFGKSLQIFLMQMASEELP